MPESLNKLHDGAVVIRNLRIAKAGVFFPMPDTKVLDKSLGSRHRAALGITEETDAVVVVVSEERGTISFCFNGNIVSNLDGASLRQALLGLFGQRGARKRGKAGAKRAGTVTQTGTGSFRITVPPPSPEARRPASSRCPARRLPCPRARRASSVAARAARRGAAKADKDAGKPRLEGAARWRRRSPSRRRSPAPVARDRPPRPTED